MELISKKLFFNLHCLMNWIKFKNNQTYFLKKTFLCLLKKQRQESIKLSQNKQNRAYFTLHFRPLNVVSEYQTEYYMSLALGTSFKLHLDISGPTYFSIYCFSLPLFFSGLPGMYFQCTSNEAYGRKHLLL